MNTTKLLGYAALGIIAGLLLENNALYLGNKVKNTTHRLKHRLDKKRKQAKQLIL